MAGRNLLADEPPKKGRNLLADDTVSTMLSGMDNPKGTVLDYGTLPVPIEEQDDQPGWDLLKKNVPMAYDAGHEVGAGIVGGVTQIPNLVPNVVNTGKSLYDLHFGSGTGAVAEEDRWKQWVDDKEGYVSNPFKTDVEAYGAPKPGYEEFRNAGRIAGSAAPFGYPAMIATPILAEAGKGLGWMADTFVDPNENQKWARTGEVVAPLGLGLLSKGVSKIGAGPETVGNAIAGAGAWAAGGPIAAALTSIFGRPIISKVSRIAAPLAAPLVNAVTGAGLDLPGLLGAALGPAASNSQQRGPR